MIFLFQGAYSVGTTPIAQLYPPEVMNYSIRTNGMALWALVNNHKVCLCLSTLMQEARQSLTHHRLSKTFVFPFALDAISWKLYNQWCLGRPPAEVNPHL
ncbi:hypothetical protein BJX99DRAFT_225008 [Aspergillus californicus]